MNPPPDETPPADTAPQILPPPNVSNAPAEPEAQNPHDVWLSVPEASAFLGVGPRRLHQLRKNGQLPARKKGPFSYQFRENDLMAFVENAAGAANTASAPAPEKPDAPAASQSIADIKAAFAQIEAARAPEPDDEGYAEQAPVVRMANAILVVGIDRRASDIHLEPGRRNTRVRIRIDGELDEVMNLPNHIRGPLTQRFLVMADLDPFGKGLQMGSILIKHNHRDYNLRVSSTPTVLGVSLTLHILTLIRPRQHEKLGMTPELATYLYQLHHETGGLLLFCGPGGSGLTTTAYSVLNRSNSESRNTVALASVLEYELGGIPTVLVQNEHEIGHVHQKRRPRIREASASLVRGGDVDALFVGDITGPESARAALFASESGVLTLATINAKTAHGGLRRVGDFAGVSLQKVAGLSRGVVVQRLVPRLNPETRQEREMGLQELENWGLPVSREPGFPMNMPVTVYNPPAPGTNAFDEAAANHQPFFVGQIGIFAFVNAREAEKSPEAGEYDLGRDALEKVLMGISSPADAGRALR